MKISYYSEIKLDPVDDPRRFVYIPVKGSPTPPDDFLALKHDYDNTARVISLLFDKIERRDKLLRELHKGVYWLCGEEYDIIVGRNNLVNIRETITDVAINEVRGRRLHEYTIMALVFGLVPLLIGAIVFQQKPFGLDGQWLAWAVAAFWILAGAAICLFGEFALRMQAGLSYEQLLSLDPGRWRPGQRLIITIVISAIFAYLLAYNFIQVGISGVLLNDFLIKKPGLALAVGGITGLAFPTVRDIIYRVRPTERK